MTAVPAAAPRVALVWAQSPRGVIGRDGALPWHVPEDLAHFKALTAGHPVVMGRATWESLPPRSRPLPGRTNVVLSRTAGLELPGASVATGLDDALALAAAAAGGDEIWVVGGEQSTRSPCRARTASRSPWSTTTSTGTRARRTCRPRSGA